MRQRIIEGMGESWRPLVPDYWFCLTAAIILGCLVVLWLWRKSGEADRRAADLLFWGIPALFAGARLFHYLQFGFPDSLSQVLERGGLALYGGLFGLLAAFFGLLSLRRKKSFEGEVFLTGMLWYALFRFLSEPLRADLGGPHPFGLLTFSQAASLVAGLSAAVGLMIGYRRRRSRCWVCFSCPEGRIPRRRWSEPP